jgi:hypothetical protein
LSKIFRIACFRDSLRAARFPFFTVVTVLIAVGEGVMATVSVGITPSCVLGSGELAIVVFLVFPCVLGRGEFLIAGCKLSRRFITVLKVVCMHL